MLMFHSSISYAYVLQRFNVLLGFIYFDMVLYTSHGLSSRSSWSRRHFPLTLCATAHSIFEGVDLLTLDEVMGEQMSLALP